MSIHTHAATNNQMNDMEQTFTYMLHELLKRQAFPFPYTKGEDPYIIQTHASAIILTPQYVYKLKKPRNFGFFDYSTASLRRHFCQMEVILNDPLAPDVYLGVAPVIESSGGGFTFGHIYPPGNVPMPGDYKEGGIIVDYAVVMRRLPENATVSALLHEGKVTPELMAEIAHAIAHFHIHAQTNDSIARAGCIDVILENWDENFQQIRPYIGRTIQRKLYTVLRHYVYQFLKQYKILFRQRFMQDHIRDCHGDLRLQHIYILPRADTPVKQRILLLDRIEFNERFRYGDVASEIAFLCMELDSAQRPDLSQAFLTHYIAETGDISLPALLPFYACYRACVRGKVASFLLDDPDISKVQRDQAKQEAIGLFKLAAGYTNRSRHPLLIMVGGIMGTGKSTIAQKLQRNYLYPLLSTDNIRKQLAHLDPAQPQADQFGTGLYAPERTQKTYDILNQRAQAYLQQGSSVILDGTFASRTDRQKIAQEAANHSATIFFIECTLPREITLQRLAQRWQARIENSPAMQQNASLASDGRPELYDAQARRWEAFDATQEPHIEHITISAAKNTQETLETLHTIIKKISFVEVKKYD
jgi:Uncharacterized protein conserved in bacteria